MYPLPPKKEKSYDVLPPGDYDQHSHSRHLFLTVVRGRFLVVVFFFQIINMETVIHELRIGPHEEPLLD